MINLLIVVVPFLIMFFSVLMLINVNAIFAIFILWVEFIMWVSSSMKTLIFICQNISFVVDWIITSDFILFVLKPSCSTPFIITFILESYTNQWVKLVCFCTSLYYD